MNLLLSVRRLPHKKGGSGKKKKKKRKRRAGRTR